MAWVQEQTAELAGVHQQAVRLDEGQLLGIRVAIGGVAFAARHDDHANVESVFLGELVVPLVVRGDGHDGAGAVVHEDVVGDPDGHRFVVERIDGEASGVDAMLVDGAHVADFLGLALFGDHFVNLGAQRSSFWATRSATRGCSGASCKEVAP